MRCNNCGRNFGLEEFDYEEDSCLYCLYPETRPTMLVLINHDYGYGRNTTDERELLDNLESIPTKQGRTATLRAEAYKNRKLYK